VIPRSVNPERIAANLDLMQFSLDPDQVAQVDMLSRHLA
jgi:diketogulonate reductase-like aldo/keto reductase